MVDHTGATAPPLGGAPSLHLVCSDWLDDLNGPGHGDSLFLGHGLDGGGLTTPANQNGWNSVLTPEV